MKDKVVKEIERIIEKSDFKAIIYEYDARRWSRLQFILGIPATVVSAIVGTASFTKLYENNSTIIGVSSFIVAALSALNTFLSPGEKASANAIASNNYEALKGQARRFINVELEVLNISNESDQRVIQNELKELQKRYDEINNLSPLLPNLSEKKIVTVKRKRKSWYLSKRKKK